MFSISLVKYHLPFSVPMVLLRVILISAVRVKMTHGWLRDRYMTKVGQYFLKPVYKKECH
jgi:hypothetical protein